MKIKAPSPAMGVALLALCMASTGTAVAAATYASNAGKVDGRDAVSSQSSIGKAAGALVATAGAGPLKGKIPGKFLAEVMQGEADSFARLVVVNDNATDVPGVVSVLDGLGDLSATCGDQNTKAGVEDPITQLIFANRTGTPINFARSISNREPEIGIVAPGTTATVNIGGSATFRITLEQGGLNYIFDGVVRQDGRNTADAQCLLYGYSQRVSNTR